MRIEQALDRFGVQGVSPKRPGGEAQSTKASQPFAQVLENAQNEAGVKFSKHALMRMEQRSMVLKDEEREQLNEAVQTAEGKGIRDSLVLMGGKAFIVNIPKNVVVTVMGQDDMAGQNVFTHIDGVILK